MNPADLQTPVRQTLVPIISPMPATTPTEPVTIPPMRNSREAFPSVITTQKGPSVVPKTRQNNDSQLKYNGGYNANTALQIALALSLSEGKPDPRDLFHDFSTAFHAKRFGEALQVYKQACSYNSEAMEIIHSQLDTIPWRIACEYYYTPAMSGVSGKMHWLNSWIKIGWWHPDDYEISPQLEQGRWITNGSCSPRAIETKSFHCVVWEGMGRDMILHLMSCDAVMASSGLPVLQTNIELELQHDFWVPINVAFKEPKSSSNCLDLVKIEVGSLEKLSPYNLDSLRRPFKVQARPNGSMRFFVGCTIGSAVHFPYSDFTLDSDEECGYEWRDLEELNVSFSEEEDGVDDEDEVLIVALNASLSEEEDEVADADTEQLDQDK